MKKEKPAAVKRHHSERFRGPAPMFVERFTNAKSAHIAFHIGLGRTSIEVEEIIGDGTSSATIRHIARQKWKLPLHLVPGRRVIAVPVSWQVRKKLEKLAAELGISQVEVLRRITAAAIMDGLYHAIVDDRK